MEIDITEFVTNEDPYEFSASVAERGPNAGPDTWRNAVTEAERAPLLTTPEQLDALRDWARATGAWTEAEAAAWSDTECNALFVQLISGDLREIESLYTLDNGDIDWPKYRDAIQRGEVSGDLFNGTDGRIYYELFS